MLSYQRNRGGQNRENCKANSWATVQQLDSVSFSVHCARCPYLCPCPFISTYTCCCTHTCTCCTHTCTYTCTCCCSCTCCTRTCTRTCTCTCTCYTCTCTYTCCTCTCTCTCYCCSCRGQLLATATAPLSMAQLPIFWTSSTNQERS